MRQLNRLLIVNAVVIAGVGCTTDSADFVPEVPLAAEQGVEELPGDLADFTDFSVADFDVMNITKEKVLNSLNSGQRVTINRTIEGRLTFPTNLPANASNLLLNRGDLHSYLFEARAGSIITVRQFGVRCNEPNTLLGLFEPEDFRGRRKLIAVNDNVRSGNCRTDSELSRIFLRKTGEYELIATSAKLQGGGTYGLSVECNSSECTPEGALTFDATRISQAQIDAGEFTPQEVFAIGDFLFEFNFSPELGLGNGLERSPGGLNLRPNMRKVHEGGFGGPDATNCITCHNVGGEDGGGDLDSNIFQAGDGFNRESALERNPPTVVGLGYRQEVGIELTRALQAQLAVEVADAKETEQARTVDLFAKGISFGSVVVSETGDVDFTGLDGIDEDLVVRPFGVKGRESNVRTFSEGGFRVHFNMAPEPTIARHCANPIPAVVGNGPNCEDPDEDGIENEISEGQLTSIAVYFALLEAPVEILPKNFFERRSALRGKKVFEAIDCAGCHKPSVILEDPIHEEFAELSGGAPLVMDLRTDTEEPRPEILRDGRMLIQAYTDYKRHDMGPEMADIKPFRNIPASVFATPPLWGVAVSPPYMHDGSAPTLRDAIEAHGGEGAASARAFAALSRSSQADLIAFLNTLTRGSSE